MKSKVLIIDDDPVICESLQSLLEGKKFKAKSCHDGASALDLVSSFAPDICLLDVRLPDADGMELMHQFKEKRPGMVVIIITAYGSVQQSVEAMNQGADDYVLKPFNVDEIVVRIDKAMGQRALEDQVDYLTEKRFGGWEDKYVVGPNAQMRKLFDGLERVAKSGNTTVLINGETGTGKEVIAQRIHNLSERKSKPFVEINATALTAELLESELFGHEAGSFTGATKQKKGLFEVAGGGTLFLDEIGDMALPLQAKILRALQEHKIRRVGGTENIDIDIRLITATNKNLAEAVAAGLFREDLYYRLNVVPIELPPLRDRSDDIESLVEHFIKSFNKEFGREINHIEAAALEAMRNYPWPGNIRELRNFIERTMLLECEGNKLRAGDLKFPTIIGREGSAGPGVAVGASSLVGSDIPLERVERAHIEGVLAANKGNKNRTAQILGIDRTTLYNKIKKYSIET